MSVVPLSVVQVPLVEVRPSCGVRLTGQNSKVNCPNVGCVLYRRIIESCAGD